MSRFEVSTGDLHGLAGQLSSLVGDLGQAGQIQPDISAAGHPIVAASLESFFADWSYGLNAIENNLSQLSQRLGGAAGTYESTESSVAADFRVG